VLVDADRRAGELKLLALLPARPSGSRSRPLLEFSARARDDGVVRGARSLRRAGSRAAVLVDLLDARRNQISRSSRAAAWTTQPALAVEAAARVGVAVGRRWLAAVGEIEAPGLLASHCYGT
jgi:hypothetical protein